MQPEDENQQPNPQPTSPPSSPTNQPTEHTQLDSSSPTVITPNQQPLVQPAQPTTQQQNVPYQQPPAQPTQAFEQSQPIQVQSTAEASTTFSSPQPVENNPFQPVQPQQSNPPTTNNPQPFQTSQPMSGGGDTNLLAKKPKKRKPLILSFAVVALLLLTGTGFVFGYYLPNQPANVWNTGLSRTGDEFTAFIDKLADPATIETLSKNKMTFSGKIISDYANVDISLDSTFDETKSDNELKVSAAIKDADFQPNITLQAKTEIIEGSIWPNVYFNLAGFSDLGLDAFLPGISEYDEAWIAVEQDFYEEFLDKDELNGTTNEESPLNITQEDIVSILYTFNDVTQEYIFTSDNEKGVFVLQEFITTEESEGISANRYRATINADNTVTYCKALAEAMYNNDSFLKISRLNTERATTEIEKSKEECELSEEQRESLLEPFDIWIDRKYKLIHKVRLYENLEKKAQEYQKQKDECLKNNTRFTDDNSYCDYYDRLIETGEKYVDFGQIYRGDGSLEFFTLAVSDTNQEKSTLRADIAFELDGLLLNGAIRYNDTTEGSTNSAQITITTEPYDGEIDTTKPPSAISLKEVYERIMMNTQNNYYDEQFLGINTDDEVIDDTANQQGTIVEGFLGRFFR